MGVSSLVVARIWDLYKCNEKRKYCNFFTTRDRSECIEFAHKFLVFMTSSEANKELGKVSRTCNSEEV